MLQVKDLRKEYKTGNFVQKALDGVSLNLRDNEFVAILGPSGSGKTTFLNVIGGLDRYDSGDLIINGVSTRKYRDRDWDAYRNHTIGFVFQSYNLIMHQSVLSNVELALTISGISGAERKRRAEEALVKVGLGQHLHKKPNQLSGGQMQRVAIARALVNDPDIVLADEPTGALDSETSVQVMELLKEVAKDRLVVMVTHNPDLAYQYATRIVKIKDGKVISDSDPYEPEMVLEPVHKRIGRASMSFLTALHLSFNNLRSKKARTFLVAFAGSIGIIGIALILSLSNGVNKYIENQESDALSSYPVQIQKTGFDFASLLSGGSDSSGDSSSSSADSSSSSTSKKSTKSEKTSKSSGKKSQTSAKESLDTQVPIQTETLDLMNQIQSNDLGSLKKYLESKKSGIESHVDAIEYHYDVTPQIYRLTTDSTGYSQVNPNQTYDGLNLGTSQMSSMMGTAMNTDIFSMLPENSNLYKDQYTLKAGHWPKNKNEMVLVLNQSGSLNDTVLYTLGLRPVDELQSAVSKGLNTLTESSSTTDGSSTSSGTDSSTVSSGGTSTASGSSIAAASTDSTGSTGNSTASGSSGSTGSGTSDKKNYSYKDFMDLDFYMVYPSDLYSYDSTYQVWSSKANDSAYVKNLIGQGQKLKITGIVQQKSSNSSSMLQSGIAYTSDLVYDIMDHAKSSGVVKAQMETPEINVLTGKRFDEESTDSEMDLSKLFTIDPSAMAKAFSMGNLNDLSSAFSGAGANIDYSSLFSGLDSSALTSGLGNVNQDLLSALDPSVLLDGVQVTASSEDLQTMFSDLLTKYLDYGAKAGASTDYRSFDTALQSYLNSDEGQALLADELQKILAKNQDAMITKEDFQNFVKIILPDILKSYSQYETQYKASHPNATDEEISQAYMANQAVTDIRAAIQNHPDAAETIRNRISNFKFSSEDLQEIASAFLSGYDSYAKSKGNLPVISDLPASFTAYLNSSEGQAEIRSLVEKSINTDRLQSNIEKALTDAEGKAAEAVSSQLQKVMENVMTQMMKQLSVSIQSSMKKAMSSFTVNPTAFASAIKLNMSAEDLQSVLTSMISGNNQASYDSNMEAFGYADPDDPEEIDIYPKNFTEKDKVLSILDNYNKKMKANGEKDKVITYSDTIGTLMTSVTRIVNTVTTVLVAFVAISLIVSSIMIGVITYISVLERRKEIGVLRALGASKRNIRNVFNAETFITGLLAGLIGVGLTALILIPTNLFLIPHFVPEMSVHVSLPILNAIELVALSVFLTLISGLLPAQKASKSDPVAALRTE
jgi:putative ABC transport system permease protein